MNMYNKRLIIFYLFQGYYFVLLALIFIVNGHL